MKVTKRSAAAYSLVEVLLSLFIAFSCILTIASLIPMTLDRNQISIEMINGKNLVGTILEDLRSKPFHAKQTPLYGLNFDSEAISLSSNYLYYFDSRGVFLGDRTVEASKMKDRFYTVKIQWSEKEIELMGHHCSGVLTLEWPERGPTTKQNVAKTYAIPLSLTYVE